jgi:hypothetical protein
VAEIQGRRVDLGDRNVVLVDNVDSSDDVKVDGLIRVDPEVSLLAGGYPDIDAVLGRLTDIVSFLKCDMALPGGRGLNLITPSCARLLGKER